MPERTDPLWNPTQEGDAELKRIETLLAGYRRSPDTAVAWRTAARVRPKRPRRLVVALAASMAVLGLGLAAWLPWRLQWTNGAPWQVEASSSPGTTILHVGQHLQTSAQQRARIQVARIGRIDIRPDTRVRLTGTRAGHHRIALERGSIHARIWAPPGHFGVSAGNSEALDLGCEFEMTHNEDGGGSIAVSNGWVLHQVAGQETLVPAGSTLAFSAKRSGIPLDRRASPVFRAAITQLDVALSNGKRPTALEDQVAASATPADTFALLSLLTRHPALASGPLYPKLAALLGADTHNAAHRDAWRAGSVHAINAWWDRIPRPPKAWWRNWRDAFG